MVIHDRSYQRWDGDRTVRVRGASIIAGAGIRRGVAILFRRKIPAVLLTLSASAMFLFLLVVIFLRFYVMTHADELSWSDEFLSDEGFHEFTTISPTLVFFYMAQVQWVFVALACVFLGSGLVANDRRSNALELYLSRPVSVWQYVLGKLGAISFFVSLVTVIPATILVLAQLSVDVGNAARYLDLLWRTLAAGAVIVLVPSLLMVTASSLAQRARVAGILWIGFLFITGIVLASVLSEIFDLAHFLLLSVIYNISQVMAWSLGYTEMIDPSVPVWQSGLVLLALAGGCIALILKRVRPVEIVA